MTLLDQVRTIWKSVRPASNRRACIKNQLLEVEKNLAVERRKDLIAQQENTRAMHELDRAISRVVNGAH